MELVILGILAIALFTLASIKSNTTASVSKGTWLVEGFKNGSLLYTDRVEASEYVIGPGTKFDKMIITDVTDLTKEA